MGSTNAGYEDVNDADRLAFDPVMRSVSPADRCVTIVERLNVSLNTVRHRVRRLESNGVIEKRVALIDNEKIDLPLTAFVQVRTDDHSADWSVKFAADVDSIPEIVEFYRLAHDVDYILRMMIASVTDYDRIYQQLIAEIRISAVSVSFAMEKLKFTTELPL